MVGMVKLTAPSGQLRHRPAMANGSPSAKPMRQRVDLAVSSYRGSKKASAGIRHSCPAFQCLEMRQAARSFRSVRSWWTASSARRAAARAASCRSFREQPLGRQHRPE
jgi:hypothetical protein